MLPLTITGVIQFDEFSVGDVAEGALEDEFDKAADAVITIDPGTTVDNPF